LNKVHWCFALYCTGLNSHFLQ